MGTVAAVGSMFEPNSFNNAGKPVTGNTGVANPNKGFTPTGGPVMASNNPFNPTPMPTLGNGNGGLVSGGIGATPSGGPLHGTAMSSGVSASPIAVPSTGSGSLYGAPGTSTGVASSNPGTTAAPTVTSEEQKQLTDIYGKGTGNLLASEIGNLGSDDSSYMQAYEAAMAPVNAENLATLNTTLGNEGVSGNSSAAAIANADFNSNVTSQEGLQEQQLQMNDLQQLLGLTESTEGSSQQEVSSGGFLNDLGDVLGAVGKVAAPALGGFLGSGGSLSSLFGGGSSDPDEQPQGAY